MARTVWELASAPASASASAERSFTWCREGGYDRLANAVRFVNQDPARFRYGRNSKVVSMI
jgi:hypothetical protein